MVNENQVRSIHQELLFEFYQDAKSPEKLKTELLSAGFREYSDKGITHFRFRNYGSMDWNKIGSD